MAARAVDKKYLLITSPEPLVRIQNHFNVMFLILPSAKLPKWFQSAEQDGRQSSR